MRLFRSTLAALACAVALLGQNAAAQERALGFSLTGGVGIGPSYFGSDSRRVSPRLSFGFSGLSLGRLQLGDPDAHAPFRTGTGLRGAFRVVGSREGRDELAGLDDVDRALELGLRLHHTTASWQVFGEVRHGVIGHRATVAELGANAIWRAPGGLILHAGPRAEYAEGRFMRTYFGITPEESLQSGLAAYRPGGGLQSIGFTIGAYQPLGADWGITGAIRMKRLQRLAADSPIVQQGSRDQVSASIGLTRHFNFRF